MAREIKQLIWCDLCMEIDGVQTEAEEMPPVTIGNKKPRVLAACKEHQVEFFDKFVEILESAGIFADQLDNPGRATRSSVGRPRSGVDTSTTSTGKPVVCPLVSECEARPLKNISTVSSHLRQIHGKSMFEALGKDGQLYDVDGSPIDMPEIRATREVPTVERAECDQPGCTSGEDGGPAVYEFPKNAKPLQALGVHKSKVHGIKGGGKSGNKQRQVA